MKNTREHTFFWLGVFVLPMFWSWFTLGRNFTRSQRVAAFSWLALTVAFIVCRWQALTEHLTLVAIGYPIVVGWVTIALLAWLCYRTGLFPLTLLELFFMFVILAPHASYFMNPFAGAIGRPFDPALLLLPTILVILHLALAPLKRLHPTF
jgi:hypothetical protein